MDDPSSPAPVILLYGDGSLFMSLLARELLQHTSARLILAGRDDARARRAAHALDPDGRRVGSGAASLEDGAALLALLDGVAAVVCCVRSFRGLPATLVDACLARGVAYFDCADSRAYVARVRDRRALIAERGITVGTGLGMTPGISALAVAYAIAELELTEVARIDTAIYVGSRRARGMGALAAALRCAGRPLARGVYGWSGRQRVRFGRPAGAQNVYNFDAADYDLFPGLFAVAPDRVRVRLGCELTVLNRVIWLLGLLRRLRWRWRARSPLITLLLGLSAPLRAMGEERGALRTTVRGIATRPRSHAEIRAGSFTLQARDAARLPILPCAVAVQRYLAGDLPPGMLDWRGWMPPAEMWKALAAAGIALDWQPE